MSSQILSSFVDINSRLVLVEVSIDLESGFNGSVGHNFSLDGSNVGSNIVGRLSEVEIRGIGGSSVVRVTLFRASRSSFFLRRTRETTRGDEIWLTPIIISISVSSNDSGRNPISPSLNRISSTTSVSARSTAS
jgi:hypothetical protein